MHMVKQTYYFICFILLFLCSPVWCENLEPKGFSLPTGNYLLELKHSSTGDFLVLTRANSKGSPLYFRSLATPLFRFNRENLLSVEQIKTMVYEDNNDTREIKITGELKQTRGTYKVVFYQYKAQPGLFHWTVDLHPEEPLAITTTSRDVWFYNRNGSCPEALPFAEYCRQKGRGVGVVYGYDGEGTQSTLLYWQDFSALNDYYSFSGKTPNESIVASPDGFGHLLPVPGLIPPHRDTRVADSYLYLQPGAPTTDRDKSKRFVQMMGRIYPHIIKPETQYTDWLEVARKSVVQLQDPENWLDHKGKKYLGAYVHFPGAESFCQMEILNPLEKLNQATGIGTELINKLRPNLVDFYEPGFDGTGMYWDGLAPMGSFEADPWYFIMPQILIADQGRSGNLKAVEIALNSSRFTMKLARELDYQFLLRTELKKKEFMWPNFPENDVIGGYAYYMLQCYDLASTKSQKQEYLGEAKNAVRKMEGTSFKYLYDSLMTPLGAVAAARLAKITGDDAWLEYAYIPLADMLRYSWIWEGDYGYGRHYSTFFGVNSLNGGSLLAGCEMHHCWSLTKEFYQIAEGDMLPEANLLCSEFIKYQINVYRSTLPPFLPEGAVRNKTSLGIMRKDYYVAVESLQDGWDKSGQVGQEIYGTGGVFSIPANAYLHLPAIKSYLYCEYPVQNQGLKLQGPASQPESIGLTFRVSGKNDYFAKAEFGFDTTQVSFISMDAFSINHVENNKPGKAVPYDVVESKIRFQVQGDAQYILSYGKGNGQKSGGLVNPSNRCWMEPETPVLYVEPGKPFNLSLVYENNSNQAVSLNPSFELPKNWTLENTEAVSIPAKGSNNIPYTVIPEQGAIGDKQVITVGILDNGTRKIVRSYQVNLVEALPGFYNDSAHWDGWTMDNDISRGEWVKTTQGIQISPRGKKGWGGVLKRVAVNVDKYRYLSVNVDSTTLLWGIFIRPEGGGVSFLQSDNTRTGIITYDLKDNLRGSGIQVFDLFVYSSGGAMDIDNSVWFKWIQLSEQKP